MTPRPRPHLIVVDDETMLAEMLARSFLSEAALSVAARGIFNVALAGGSTPRVAYSLLASPAFRDALDWSRVRFFFGDERCVPPEHPDSNYRMAKETLFDPLSISAANAFRMRGEDEPAAAARAYAEILARELGPSTACDLVMLGMGPDGHTASLFPGQPPDDGSADLVQVRTAPPAMHVLHRLTMTPRAINAAREVAIATTGAAKAQTVAAVLNGPYEPQTYPVQIINPASGRLTWLLDRAAASQLATQYSSSG
ncbi:MAG TPA: 6-phosphogluconolactonase [Candidatus Baltobacteraceae bacterium]